MKEKERERERERERNKERERCSDVVKKYFKRSILLIETMSS
jgi:hypothetical protein